MKIIVAFTLLFTFSSFVSAQPTKLLRVKNGQDATKHVRPKDRYQYPDFVLGKLKYRNGAIAQARLNYCYLLAEIMYIDSKGDTLAIADNNFLSSAQIADNVFLPDPGNGYVQILEDDGIILLGKKDQYQRAGVEKNGAYQNKGENGSVSNAANFTDINGVVTNLAINNTILLRPSVTYYLIDANRRMYKASRSSLFKIFPKQKKEIGKFLEEQYINFTNEAHLRNLIHFCRDLAASAE